VEQKDSVSLFLLSEATKGTKNASASFKAAREKAPYPVFLGQKWQIGDLKRKHF